MRKVATDVGVNRDEMLEFVRPRHHGIVTATRRDGRPQMSPVAMGVDPEGRVVIASYPDRAKVANLRRNPDCSVMVLSDDFGGEWIQVDGRGEVIDLPDAIEPLVDYFRSISGEHSDWDEYRQAMVDQGKVLIRIEIDRWSPISRGGFPTEVVARDGVVLETDIAGTPEQVFDHFTKPELLQTWWAEVAEVDFEKGFHLSWPNHGDTHLRGTYQRVEPGERLTFTWKFDHEELAERVVDVQFKASKGGTRILLAHEAGTDQERSDYEQGWTFFLETLNELLA